MPSNIDSNLLINKSRLWSTSVSSKPEIDFKSLFQIGDILLVLRINAIADAASNFSSNSR